MPTYTITGHPEYGIPYGSKIRIDSVADEKRPRRLRDGTRQTQKKYKRRNLVWKGIVDGEVTRNYDPGKYVYKIHKSPDGQAGGFMFHGEFLVGMTEEQFSRISTMYPKNAKPLMTTDGTRWKCEWAGCSKVSTSRIAGFVHENEDHYGVDPFGKNPMMDHLSVQKPIPEPGPGTEKRGPGRPRNPARPESFTGA